MLYSKSIRLFDTTRWHVKRATPHDQESRATILTEEVPMSTKKFAYRLIIIFDAFLALTAMAGGIGLITGLNAPPLDWLQGSIFGSFVLPGLALLVIVGGGALVATVLMLLRRPYAILVSGAVGLAIIVFEIVEVLTIGSPAGIAQGLQIFYFLLGLVIAVPSVTLWLSDQKARPEN
jgi:hypothetical protein